MPDPYYDLSSKITRAIRALLISSGADIAANIIAAPASTDRTVPNTTIDAGDSVPEIQGTGIWRFPNITITLKDSAAIQPGATNLSAPLLAANARFSSCVNTLLKSDDLSTLLYTAKAITTAGRALATSDPTNSADMADFTIQWWEEVHLSSPSKHEHDGGTFWISQLTFSAVACASAIDIT